jgi:hypothetical protein
LILKTQGKSLRQIAAALGISRMTVARRLKTVSYHNGGVTDDVTAMIREEGRCHTQGKQHPSRVCSQFGNNGNQVSHKRPPSPISDNGVTCPGAPVKGPILRCKEGFSEVLPRIDDLFGAIREFLENRSIQLYQMQVSGEAYQVKHNGQVIRFYIFREKNGKKFDSSSNPE